MPGGRIYLDHAATTPVRAEVLDAMTPYFGTFGFNASSLHAEGRAARFALDEARAKVAALLGAGPREIVFTAGGSEADNLAILGGARARRRATGDAHIVTAATEHHAVLHAAEVLRDDGFAVTVLPVDGEGRVAPSDFERALRPGTVLASIMLANNELGTLQPIAGFAEVARERGVLMHVDAVQAPGRIPLDVGRLGVDLLALSAHKVYGPKGVGALYVRAGTPLEPQIVGGGQEAGFRAGTENVAGVVGFARALELAVAELPAESARLGALRDRLERGLLAAIPDARVNAAGAARLPNVASVAFAGVDAATLLISLDLEGVAASAGSACAAGSSEPSHVITALAAPRWAQLGTIRLSLGKLTQERDIEAVLQLIPRIVAQLRPGGGRDGGRELGTSRSGSFRSHAEVRS